MFRNPLAVWMVCLVLAKSALAVEHRVEPLKESAPSGDVSPQIAAELSSSGIRVIRGSSTNLCDIWLIKELSGAKDFKPTTDILYPFQPGQLIGVVRFARKSSDFRDQDIPSGIYTLRYGQQPVDGAHVGTSPTRDFLLLTDAKKDPTTSALEYKPLAKQSAETAGSSHPALLSMQRIATEATEFPAVRHDEEKDWWIVALQAQVKSGGGPARPLVIELVVVGIAAE